VRKTRRMGKEECIPVEAATGREAPMAEPVD
jgi:hypothetical protein